MPNNVPEISDFYLPDINGFPLRPAPSEVLCGYYAEPDTQISEPNLTSPAATTASELDSVTPPKQRAYRVSDSRSLSLRTLPTYLMFGASPTKMQKTVFDDGSPITEGPLLPPLKKTKP